MPPVDNVTVHFINDLGEDVYLRMPPISAEKLVEELRRVSIPADIPNDSHDYVHLKH